MKTRTPFLHRICASIAFLSVVSVGSGLAQTKTGSLKIRVIDANKVVVPGALVTITNKETGNSRTAVTSADGLALFQGLALGIYKIEVTTSGFAKATVESIKIAPAKMRTVDVALKTEAELFITEQEREKEERGEQISALPNLNNDLTPLLQIVPGSIATGPAALGRVIIDGKGNDQRTLRLDSVDFNVLVDLPSNDSAIDAVQSLQKPEVAGNIDSPSTSSGAFSAMFGPGTGTVIDTATYKAREARPEKKSLLKIQVFEEFRNDALNARNFFDFDGKNGLRRNRFGGKVGIPLDRRDHKFLFFAYDGLRGRTERNVYEAVPNDAICGCAVGPLANVIRGYLPIGTQIMPSASLNPDFGVARRRTRSTSASNAGDVRFDYYPFGDVKDSHNDPVPKALDFVTVRLMHQRAENIVPDGITGRKQRQRFTFTNALLSLKLVGYTKLAPSGTKEFGHTFRIGFNQTRAQVNVENPTTFAGDLPTSLVTLGGTVKTTGLPGQPATVPVATLGGLIKGTGRGLDLKPASYGLSYDYSRAIKERHELFAGFEARLLRLNFDRLGGLTYAFSNPGALRPGTAATITYLSDLSGPSPFSVGAGQRQARQEFYMGYFQMSSDFKRAPNPTTTEPGFNLTYGFRYDYFSAVRERNDRAVVVDPLTGKFLPQGSAFYRTEKFNFQPRIGFAYRFDRSQYRVTILRGGFGVYSGVPRTGDLLLPIESDRFSTGISGGSFPATPTDITNQFIANPNARQFQPVAFARDFKVLERAYKWDAQLTRTIQGYDLSVIYSGNIGRNLPLANIANRIVSVITNPDPTKPAIVVRQFDIVQGGLVFKPFGEFFFRTGGGHSSYNGLTFQFKRNILADSSLDAPWKGAVKSLNVQYTISRNVGNANGTVVSNPLDLESDFGFNSGDIRHSFKVSAVYDLWATKVDNKPDNPLLGWKIMPVLKVSSGFPFTIRLTRPDIVYVDAAGNVFGSPAVGRTAVINTPGGGESGSARVPDLIPGVSPYLRGGLEVLNPAAFAIPAPGKFGNYPRGLLRGPAIVQLDIGIRRNLFERTVFKNETKVSGQFQVDFYNILNRANFLNPTVALPGLLGTSVADNQLQPGVPFSRATAGTFGIISAADIGRVIQFSLTLRFNDGFTK